MRILVIATNVTTRYLIQATFEREGIAAEFQQYSPDLDRLTPLPTASELSSYDIVFLDPELFSADSLRSSDMSTSLRAGANILVHIRTQAPKLPVVAITAWLASSPALATEVTMLPFDAYVARELLMGHGISRSWWERLLKHAVHSRASASDRRPTERSWDVFICHASEEKLTVVEPLVSAFRSVGISCWYDRDQILWGDSIVEKISTGLASARYVLVVLSQVAVSKSWPQKELSSALSHEIDSREARILPLYVGDDEALAAMKKAVPLLADKRYLRWTGASGPIVDELRQRLQR